MANTITITSVEASGQNMWVTFKIKLTGSYASGGEILDFTKATIDPVFLGLYAGFAVSLQTPICPDAWSTTGQIINVYFFVAGLLNACKLKMASAIGTELGAGAYSAGMLADTIEGQLILNKNI